MTKRHISTTFLLLLLCSGFFSCGMLEEALSPKTSHTETHSSKNELRLRNNIVDFAKKHLGTKYRYGGTSPSGFDCSGFVSYVMKKFSVPVTGPSYSQEKLGEKINSKQAQPGDLIFFRRSKTGKVFHVAIVYANNSGSLSVIHSTTNRGVVIDDLSESDFWRTKYATLRRVIGT